jgi:hypothetical protein
MSKMICQSCGMPMAEEKLFGKNADGTKNEDYCCYCYPNGAFSKEETMDEMIESCIPFMLKDGSFQNEGAARAMMRSFLPNLKRWKE